MGETLSFPEGSEPDEGQLLSQLIQLLLTRPHHTLLLSDLSVLLPSNLRKLADSRGGIRAWLQRWPDIIQVSGEPGRESATLVLLERGEQTLQLSQPRDPDAQDAAAAEGPPPEGTAGAPPELESPSAQAPKRADAPPFDEETDGHCAVQLRGLPYRATVEDVRGFLGEFAESLAPENAVHLVLNRDGRPSGFARVQFVTPEAARLCRDGTHLRCMEDRYVEVFLYSERPSRGRKARNEDGSVIPGDAFGGGAADATGVTKEQVVKEVRMAMAEPKNRHQLLSMLGVALSQGARAYLRQIDQGLKHFLAQFPGEFSVDGGKGCEYVTYRPVQVTDGDGAVPNYTPIQLSEALAPPAQPQHLAAHDVYAAAAGASAALPPYAGAAAARAVGSSASAVPKDDGDAPGSPAQMRSGAAATDPTPAGCNFATPSDRGMPSPAPPWGSLPWQPEAGVAPPWPGDAAQMAAMAAGAAAGAEAAAAAWGVPQWGMSGHGEWMAPPFGWDYGAAAAAASGDAAAAAFAAAAHHAASRAAAAPAAMGMVRLRGLPFTSTEQDVLAFFAQNDIVERVADGPKAVSLLVRPNGRPTGQAEVQMRSRADAEVAQQVLSGKWMGNRYIEVFPHADDGSVPGMGISAADGGNASAAAAGSTNGSAAAAGGGAVGAAGQADQGQVASAAEAQLYPYSIATPPWAPWAGAAAGGAGCSGAPENSWEALFDFLDPEVVAAAGAAAMASQQAVTASACQ